MEWSRLPPEGGGRAVELGMCPLSRSRCLREEDGDCFSS